MRSYIESNKSSYSVNGPTYTRHVNHSLYDVA